MPHEWFTPLSASDALERVRPLAESLCATYRELEKLAPDRVASDQRVAPAYYDRVRRLHLALAELDRMGVMIKDLRRGLVDFPARRGGRDVLLCWRVGEPRLKWWHECEDGFGGRRPVDDDGPWEEPDEVLESVQFPG
jgi:hypothetical protein